MEEHITAGPKALAAMARLLGLSGAGKGWRLDGFCWTRTEQGYPRGDESVRLSLMKGAHRLVFYLLSKTAANPHVRAAGLSIRAEVQPGAAIKRFLEAFAATLGKQSLADVFKLIERDPESFREKIPVGREGDHLVVPYVGAPIGLIEAGWRNFFCDQDFDVLLGVPYSVPDRAVTLEYADLECFNARPQRSFQKWSFRDWPVDGTDGKHLAVDKEEPLIRAELEEKDMILGSGEKADALVEEVRRLASAGNYLVVTHLCTPIILGDDFNGLARRLEEASGSTAVSWGQKDRDQKDNFGEFFSSVLSRSGFFDTPGDPEAVNLFHFPWDLREEMIRPFLDEIGLKVNVCMFPDVHFPSIEDIPKAAVQIFCEKSSQTDRVLEIIKKTSRKVVTVRAPYGIEGTRECLRGIAKAAGKEKRFEAAWAGRLEAVMPSWEKMKKEARGLRVAFVVTESTLPMLSKLRFGQGAPLLTMLLEMGFGIDFLYYERHGEMPELPGALAGSRVTTFRSPWELEKALRGGEFRAVYSDIFFDWRLSGAGKARFSARDFGLGLKGALRSFERMLAVCRLPFYHRYGSRLARIRSRAA